MTNRYCYGSGMFGCLYDNGPNFCDHKAAAVEALMFDFFEQLAEGEAPRMQANLFDCGFHAFADPLAVGVEYCEITEGSR